MDLKRLVENLNFRQRKELCHLLRDEFETFGYRKDGDMTVKEWVVSNSKEKMSTKLYDYLMKDGERLIAKIDVVEILENLGKRATNEFLELRGY